MFSRTVLLLAITTIHMFLSGCERSNRGGGAGSGSPTEQIVPAKGASTPSKSADSSAPSEDMLYGTWKCNTEGYGELYSATLELRKDMIFTVHQTLTINRKLPQSPLRCEGRWKITRSMGKGYVLELINDAAPNKPYGWTVEFLTIPNRIWIQNFDSWYDKLIFIRAS